MLSSVTAAPLFGVATTVIAYAAAQAVHARWRWVHPLLVTCGALVALLLVGRVPYENYKVGGDFVSFFLGPATIALGVPLYKHATRIRRHLVGVVISVGIGSACGLASAAGFVWLLGGSGVLLRSMLPKSVTTPIAIQISQAIGGAPALTSLFVVLTGFMGVPISRLLLRRLPLQSTAARGALFGLGAHAMGVALAMGEHARTGTIASLVMILTGIFTLVIMPWLLPMLLHIA